MAFLYLTIFILVVLLGLFFLLPTHGLQEKQKRKRHKIEEEYNLHSKRYFEKKERQILKKIALDKERERVENNYHYANLAQEDVRIVGIRKPIGKWTKFVTLQKLAEFAMLKRIQGSSQIKNFWQTLVKAQQQQYSSRARGSHRRGGR